MIGATAPLNWLDWVLLLALASGAVAGWRRGLLLSLAVIAAALGALVLAVHFSPGAATYAQSRWHAEGGVAAFLGRYLSLPAGSAQIPYSRSALQLYLQQLQTQGGLAAAYAAAVRSMTAQGIAQTPVSGESISGLVDMAIARRLVVGAAFAGVFVVAQYGLWLVARLLLWGVPRRGGWRRGVNASLGALCGVAARLVQLTALFALLASLSVFPATAGLAAALRSSRWAPLLLAGLRHAMPGAHPWMDAWLASG